MNRRGFLGAMLKAGVAAMVLPGAGRKWVTSAAGIHFVEPKLIVPFWSQTLRSSMAVDQGYLEALKQVRPFCPVFETKESISAQKAFVQDFFFNKPISENKHLAKFSNAEKYRREIQGTWA